jgi:hypothetical protein
MRIAAKFAFLTAMLLVALAVWGSIARAATITIGPSAFPPGSPLIDFTGMASAEVNNLTVNGVTFQTRIGGVPANGLATIGGGGPGLTNNVNPPA